MTGIAIGQARAQCNLSDLHQAAEIIVQGYVARDTVYEANGWVYTSYILEVCDASSTSAKLKGKALAITRMGGEFGGISYSGSHSLDIGMHVYGMFFLNQTMDDNITPSNFLAVTPVCGEAGFVRYLREDFVPQVEIDTNRVSAAAF